MNYKLIREWKDWNETISPKSRVFCDTETCTEEGKTKGGLYGAIRLIQIHQEHWGHLAYLFDCRFLDLESVLELLKDYHLVFHNAAYDLHTINCHTKNFWFPRGVDDTLYLSRLALYDRGDKFDFFSCLKYCDLFTEDMEGIDKSANQKADWGGVLSEQMLIYAAFDALKLRPLFDCVQTARDTESYRLDISNLKYAIEYSRRGIPVNRDTIRKRRLKATQQYEELLEILPVNPNSPKQCSQLLKSSSTDVETLARLTIDGVPWAKEIREARGLSKKLNFLQRYDRDIIRGFYNPSQAVGGRFRCTGGDRFGYDNLQQIPRDLLHVLEAPEGKVFVYKDYSGLELRIVVAWTGELVMAKLMRDGVDVHTFTACELFDKTEETMVKEDRLVGKTFTFASLYGAKEAMVQSILRTDAGVILSISAIKRLMKKYFSTYQYFETWHDIYERGIKTYGFMDVRTALGRNIRTTKLTDSLAIPIQGSASEVTKVSLSILKSRYPDENLISTIHDSNTLLVDEQDRELWRDRLNECMIEAWYYVIKDLPIPDLPMPAEAEFGKVWDF